MSLEDRVLEALVEAIRVAETRLPLDVYEALASWRDRVDGVARAQLEAILENVELAAREGRPICQDTGLISFYVSLPDDYPVRLSRLHRLLREAVRRATRLVPLRPNAVHPVTHENTGDNTGLHVPVVHVEPGEGGDLVVTVVPKGGGSEYPSRLYMIPPAAGLPEALRRVVDAVVEADGLPCPPTIVGVGIGGTVEEAVALAKRAAVLRPVGSRNGDERLAALEERLLGALNRLGIGPMGLGGEPTVLDVHVEVAHRHPATYPVAVVFNCWAARRATVRIAPGGSWEIISRHYEPG